MTLWFSVDKNIISADRANHIHPDCLHHQQVVLGKLIKFKAYKGKKDILMECRSRDLTDGATNSINQYIARKLLLLARFHIHVLCELYFVWHLVTGVCVCVCVCKISGNRCVCVQDKW